MDKLTERRHKARQFEENVDWNQILSQMGLFTEDDEERVAEDVAQNASGDESLDELVERAVDESGGRINPTTARRLLRARLDTDG